MRKEEYGTGSSYAIRQLLGVLAVACLTAVSYAGTEPEPWDITVPNRYNAQGRRPKVMTDFLNEHPRVRVRQWSGISLPGGPSASLTMAMAGNIGPDIFEMDIRQAVANRLAYPLTDWIGQDGVRADGSKKLKADGRPDRNGQIDADEARWDGWMKISPVFRQVVTVDGVPYALPMGSGTHVGILYSQRLLRRAGLDPAHPPRSYEEFIYWARKLYNHETATPAVELSTDVWAFAPWVSAAGGSIVVQDRTSPATGKVYTFREQETRLVAADTGEDLSGATPTWRCNVASPESMAPVAFFHRLRWQPWIRDPVGGEPVELTEADVAAGRVTVNGREITFTADQVVAGCIRVSGGTGPNPVERLGRDLALLPLFGGGNLSAFENAGLQPDDLGLMPFPGRDASQRPALQASNSFFMMGKDVFRRGGRDDADRKGYRDAVWNVMTIICSSEGQDESIRESVAAGKARFINPRDLRRLGFDEYLQELPPEQLALWDRLDRGEIMEVVEPFMGKWLQFRDFYGREVIDLVLRPSGRDFDYSAALKRLERDANGGIMFEQPAAVLDSYRPRARWIAAGVGAAMVLILMLIVRDQLKRKASTAGVYKGYLPWLLLLPALASIGIWRYYPLLRGLVMAFQDYKIVGDSAFVGLSNFIGIALDPNFYHYLWTTCRFVLWNLALAFFTPIILALLLSEVPRFKTFFRTLFFLPHMTSGLVVTLMWKEMFAGTADGSINRLCAALLDPLHAFAEHLHAWAGCDLTAWLARITQFTQVDWLGTPSVVMACVIIPGVWAGAGIGSLIYLAALKSVPDELYEAANIDGAGIRHRIWKITLPTILPLVMINFVGAFIGTFQSMGSIFLLTFGGPGKETMVMSMAIWQEAYVNLRFSLATSYAWILGGILISFTYLQLRILRRVDFRQTKGV